MIDLATAVQILNLLPPLAFGTPAVPAAERPQGTGTLLITACRAGEPIIVMPGRIQALAGDDGTVKIAVPAQAQEDNPYMIENADGAQSRIHGTLRANELLSGVCP